MSEYARLLWDLVGGVALGLIYFGGLWMTVRRLPSARFPALLLLVSAIGRGAVALLGLYALAGPRWDGLLAGMAGFAVARVALVRRLRPAQPGDGGPRL